MILGNGIDIVDTNRILNAYRKFGDAFAKKVLSDDEFDIFLRTKTKTNNDIKKIVSLLSKHWAVKEAVSKAVGCGLINGSPLHFKDVVLNHNFANAPEIVITEELLNIVRVMYNLINQDDDKIRVHISTTSDGNFVVANAILELLN